ncbi:MAG: fumarylacetoacetate hydrolase family protein [Symbiobacterium sp.]|uniref:2-keto-4-pentenoate hydratase n=1 Tax=Symbiobacterium sp. TaxID=1971213 RepID=UPI003464E800
MALAAERIAAYAAELDQAERTRKPIGPLTAREPELTPDDAYRIQLAWMDLRIQRGARVVGKKIGLTSHAMQSMLGVFEPDYGHVLDTMVIAPGDPVALDELVQPKVEGEIAFILGCDVPTPATALDVLLATRLVVPALEIVDSRIEGWQIRLPDTVADNASSGRVVLAERGLRPDELDLTLVGMVFEKNGEMLSSGAGAAVLGNPAAAVAWLANKLAQFDIPLRAGEIILSGAITAAVEARPGDLFTARFGCGLGSVSARFV